ncbi:MAG TPA: hypothetical protein VGD69_06220 [Herpetosiphonaceae bacterium]
MNLSIIVGTAWGAAVVGVALIDQASMFVLIQEIQAGLAASTNCQKVLTGEPRTENLTEEQGNKRTKKQRRTKNQGEEQRNKTN